MPNIAVVVLDTLRKDAYERHFDWIPGRQFDNAWSTSNWTAPAHASLFGGKYGSELGVDAKTPHLDCPEPLIAELLAEADYTTRAFSCNPFISSSFKFDRGFNHFHGSWRLRHLDPSLFNWGEFITKIDDPSPTRYFRALFEILQSDAAVLPSLKYGIQLKLRDIGLRFGGVKDDGAESALKHISNTVFGENEFFFLNLMETHAPYNPPNSYKKSDITDLPGLEATVGGISITEKQRAGAKTAYEGSAAYLSDVYEKIFTELTTEFDYIVTLADHGELFGEHGSWKHVHGVYPEIVHIPVSFSGPNQPNETIEQPISILDLHATLIDLADLAGQSKGNSLLNLEKVNTTPKLTEFCGLREAQLATLRRKGYAQEVVDRYEKPLRGIVLPTEYYGYETPHEFKEIGPAPIEDPIDKLTREAANLEKPKRSQRNHEVTEKVLKQLEDLGYG